MKGCQLKWPSRRYSGLTGVSSFYFVVRSPELGSELFKVQASSHDQFPVVSDLKSLVSIRVAENSLPEISIPTL